MYLHIYHIKIYAYVSIYVYYRNAYTPHPRRTVAEVLHYFRLKCLEYCYCAFGISSYSGQPCAFITQVNPYF